MTPLSAEASPVTGGGCDVAVRRRPGTGTKEEQKRGNQGGGLQNTATSHGALPFTVYFINAVYEINGVYEINTV